MGNIVEFPSNGGTGSGYFAPADNGGPGVIVIQEWWGLVPHVTDICDRFASAGFSALAPDLYRGESTTEPDEAGKLMMALNVGQAVQDMSGAISFLQSSDSVTSATFGVVGYCMGGGLALVLACERPDVIAACAPHYGLIPWAGAQPDYSQLTAIIRGHYAENDSMFGPDAVAELQATLDAAGKDAVLRIHPGTDHAFFNDDRPEVYDPDASAAAWSDTLELFTTTLS